jgi:hypothetical protein
VISKFRSQSLLWSLTVREVIQGARIIMEARAKDVQATQQLKKVLNVLEGKEGKEVMVVRDRRRRVGNVGGADE